MVGGIELRRAVLGAALLCGSGVAGASQAAPSPAGEADRLFRQGSAAFEKGDLRAAETTFARLVRVVPRAGAAHSAYGATLLAEGKAEAAVAELVTALRLDPGDIRAAINLGRAYSALHEDGKAVEAFGRALQMPGAVLAPEESIVYGRSLVSVGDLAGAQETLTSAVASSPVNGMANGMLLDSLGAVLARTGRMRDAETRFRQAIAADGGNAGAYAHLGSALLARGEAAGAIEQMQKALDLGDRSPATRVELSRALLAEGRAAEAETAAREALKADPNAPEAMYALALALQAGVDPAKALPLFAEVSKVRTTPDVLTNYGLCLVQTGEARGALELYRKALALGGTSSTLREDMGSAYLQLNKVDEAIDQYRLGLEKDPDSPQLHYDLGLAYKLKDDTGDAVAELKRAEQLDPQLPDAAYTLGVLEMQQGEFADAARELGRAVELQPRNGEAWSLLGSVYQQAREPEKAANALRHAIELLPAQPSPHVTLAAVLAGQGDRQGAAAERKIAADLSRAAVSHQRAQFALDSGKALLAKGKVEDALVQLRDAVQAEPASAATHRALADALDRSGQRAEAAREREQADDLARRPAPVGSSVPR